MIHVLYCWDISWYSQHKVLKLSRFDRRKVKSSYDRSLSLHTICVWGDSRNQLALLGDGISTIGFPCNDVYNRTVHTYIHTNVRSVSAPGSVTAPVKNVPAYSSTASLSVRTDTNTSQALSENKVICKPVLAFQRSTHTKMKIKRRKRLKSLSWKSSGEEERSFSFLLACVFLIFFRCPSFFLFHLKCFVVER